MQKKNNQTHNYTYKTITTYPLTCIDLYIKVHDYSHTSKFFSAEITRQHLYMNIVIIDYYGT